MPALAQEASVGGRGLTVETSFTAASTYTELRGTSVDGSRLGSELITQFGPGLRLRSRAGRVQGTLDYTLLATVHARRTDFNTLTNNLTGNLRAELVPGWAYVDGTASAGQQAATVYGLQQTQGSLRSNENLRETTSVSLSPYIRGNAFGFADYEFRLFGATTDVRGATDGDSTNLVATQTLRSRLGPRLGWALQSSQQRVDFRAGRPTDLFRTTASLSFAPDPDLVFTARAGEERTDIGSDFRRRYSTWGGGVRWTPSPRTSFSLDADRRFFGDAYQLVLEHRMRRTAVRFSSVRDSTSGTDANGVGQPITLLQLYLLQFASIEPDPVLREQRVREFLRLTNQDPGSLVSGGLASSAVSLQQRNDLSVSYAGLRTTFTAQAFSSSTRVIDRQIEAQGDRIRQVGATFSANHRLTPISNASVGLSYLRTQDPAPLQPRSDQTTLSLGYTTTLSRQVTGSLTARYSLFDGAPFSNRETSVTASVNVRF